MPNQEKIDKILAIAEKSLEISLETRHLVMELYAPSSNNNSLVKRLDAMRNAQEVISHIFNELEAPI
jgi:hypothetical protein